MKRLTAIVSILLAVSLISGTSFGQDAVKADPKHYKVEFENDQVRVLRISYGPHEKSVMHSHPEGVVVVLDDAKVKMVLPNGKAEENTMKAGSVMWTPASAHHPENITDKSFEIIQIEMKTKTDAKKKDAK